MGLRIKHFLISNTTIFLSQNCFSPRKYYLRKTCTASDQFACSLIWITDITGRKTTVGLQHQHTVGRFCCSMDLFLWQNHIVYRIQQKESMQSSSVSPSTQDCLCGCSNAEVSKLEGKHKSFLQEDTASLCWNSSIYRKTYQKGNLKKNVKMYLNIQFARKQY